MCAARSGRSQRSRINSTAEELSQMSFAAPAKSIVSPTTSQISAWTQRCIHEKKECAFGLEGCEYARSPAVGDPTTATGEIDSSVPNSMMPAQPTSRPPRQRSRCPVRTAWHATHRRARCGAPHNYRIAGPKNGFCQDDIHTTNCIPTCSARAN